MAHRYIGKRFGRFLVLKRRRWSSPGTFKLFCKCSCGNHKWIRDSHVVSGHTQSCGCLVQARRTHGLSKNRVYPLWKAMINRCHNPKSHSFNRYGGRGIKVCKRWMNVLVFLEDMGPPPSPHHSVDRINNNKGYSPTNCRWATPKEQARNMRTNHHVRYNGKSKTVAEWSEILKIPYGRLYFRVRNPEWSTSKAFQLPKQIGSNKLIEFKGKRKLLSEWAAITGQTIGGLWQRIFVHKWTVERALTQKPRKSA